MNKLTLGMAVTLAVMLSGCIDTSPNQTNEATVAGQGGGADVQLVTLRDGTRCAVMVGAYKGGIDCDWRRP